ncbi:MAG: gephyrin-like molybdotransferase Glp [Flavobacteriaceae bacterium]
MIGVEEARRIVREIDVRLPKVQVVSLEQASGYTLAKNLYCPFDLPSFEQSIMDGYAIHYKESNPLEFEVIAEIQAGSKAAVILNQGQAARIFTGAPIPSGANAVVMQEQARQLGNQLYIENAPKPNQHIRAIGADLKKEQLLFESGFQLNASSLGVLKSLGFKEVEVYRKPVVSIVVTGDELVSEDRPLQKGEIYESNSTVLKAALESNGIAVQKVIAVKDDFEATREALKGALKSSDLTLVSGGISVGAYDFVYRSLQELAVDTYFYKVKQKPGKPLFFGGLNNNYIFALPGNPGSALTCFYMYVLPFLKRMQNTSDFESSSVALALEQGISNTNERALFLKAKRNGNNVRILEHQSSSKLLGFAMADVLVYIPETTGELVEGTLVDCFIIA